MHFKVKMEETATKNIFRNKRTANKVSLIFLDVKVLTERQQLRFCTLSRNKQGIVYVFIFEKPQNNHEKRSIVVRKLKPRHE